MDAPENLNELINEWMEKNKNRIPYTRKFKYGIIEVYNGSESIYMNKEGYKKYIQYLNKIANDTISTK